MIRTKSFPKKEEGERIQSRTLTVSNISYLKVSRGTENKYDKMLLSIKCGLWAQNC